MPMTAAPAGTRIRIGRLLDRRRGRFRRTLVLLLGALERAGATPSESGAAVHDLCARELAKRVRLLRREISHSPPPASSRRDLLDAIRTEVDDYLAGETADLADDEAIARRMAARVPRLLPRPRRDA